MFISLSVSARLSSLVGFVFLSSVLSVQAQPMRMHQAQRLLHLWATQQTEQLRQVQAFAFTEKGVWKLDGALDVPVMEIETQVAGRTADGSEMWEREIVSASVEGQPVSAAQAQALLAQRQARVSSAMGPLLSAPPLPVLKLAPMLAVAPPETVELEGESCWKFDVLPRPKPGSNTPTARITLWLRRADKVLLRSQVVFLTSGSATTSVTTSYQRVSGLDVPKARRLEILLQEQRRLRVFTSLLTLDALYSDYRLSSD